MPKASPGRAAAAILALAAFGYGAAVLAACRSGGSAQDPAAAFVAAAAAKGPLDPAGLPAIGPWLEYADGKPADWLGLAYQGRTLREPINLVVLDRFADTAETAVAKLLNACKRVGYEEEFGHSAGYRALIDGRVYKQIPNDKHMAFANKDFLATNNHGRIAGPAPLAAAAAGASGGFAFAAGFSTERPTVRKGLHHSFVSFRRARDDFAWKLAAGGAYRAVGVLELGNVLDTATETTADHDGLAVVFEAVE
jgi:hypothetical protein